MNYADVFTSLAASIEQEQRDRHEFRRLRALLDTHHLEPITRVNSQNRCSWCGTLATTAISCTQCGGPQ